MDCSYVCGIGKVDLTRGSKLADRTAIECNGRDVMNQDFLHRAPETGDIVTDFALLACKK